MGECFTMSMINIANGHIELPFDLEEIGTEKNQEIE